MHGCYLERFEQYAVLVAWHRTRSTRVIDTPKQPPVRRAPQFNHTRHVNRRPKDHYKLLSRDFSAIKRRELGGWHPLSSSLLPFPGRSFLFGVPALFIPAMKFSFVFATVTAVVSAVVGLDVGTLKGTLLPGTCEQA